MKKPTEQPEWPMRLLVVDDDRDFLRMVAGTFRGAGWAVYIATSAPEALELAAAHDLDLAIVDIQLPRMTGIDMVRQMRTAGNHLPVILVTAQRSAATAAVARSALGVDAYLEKPLNLGHLVRESERIVKQHQRGLAAPRFLHDFVAELVTLGRPSFEERYTDTPVLIGMGLATTFSELGNEPRSWRKRKRPKTFPVDEIDPIEVERVVKAQSLSGRVWRVAASRARNGFAQTAITVGRGTNNDVVIPEYSISENHAELRFDDGRLVLVDRGSSNGTIVGRRRLQAGELAPVGDGDSIVLGRFRFELCFGPSFVQRIIEKTTRERLSSPQQRSRAPRGGVETVGDSRSRWRRR